MPLSDSKPQLIRPRTWFDASRIDDVSTSGEVKLSIGLPEKVHLAISIALLIVSCVLDAARPFDRSWSILYLVVAVYAAQTLQDRTLLLFDVITFITVILVPAIFRPDALLPGARLFYRVTGIIAAILMTMVMWDRRRMMQALQLANKQLESKNKVRKSELLKANASLQQEIAERKLTEETVEMMRFCIERAGDAVFWIGPDARILYANDTACTERGYTREELQSLTVFELDFEPEYRPQHWPALFNDLRNRKSKTFETRHQAKDGTVIPVEVCANLLVMQDRELIFAFVRCITKRKQLDNELRTSRQRLQLLSRQLITTQETERRHMARELHDEVGQVLTAIKMSLNRSYEVADADVRSQLGENLVLVDEAIGQIRNLSLQLRPPHLDELGLVAALHWLIRQQSQLGSFEGVLDVDLGDQKIPSEYETVCFRIAQEALTNTIRHGKPRKVSMKLMASDGELSLSIADDGRGFNVCESRKNAMNGESIGLISMQERASIVGGRTEIESVIGNGTTVCVRLPLEKA